jgi:saccharopine dehydrogenase-like NADP-dependent oxidoreductase
MDMITNSDKKTSGGTLDTGIPCSIAAQMIASGNVKMSGVCAPESSINPEIMFKELRKRGIAVLKNSITIN